MSGMKEIRSKIKSVQNTRKITKAMEMVAASKMRKAQDRMRAARPYADKVRNICANLAKANPEYRHEYMVARDTIKNVAAIVVTTDKGLCGGLNTNVLRLVTNKFQEFEAAGAKVRATAIGSKGAGFFGRVGVELSSKVVAMGDTPHLDTLIGAIKVQLDAYVAGEVDAVYLAYTRFVNTMKQEAVFEQLLPLGGDRLQADEGSMSWDYIYEPDAKAVIDDLLLRYVEALVYQAVAENMASEQSARMVAMKAASDNAKNVISELQLTYNKARQAAITKELAEIVGGAAAV
ncbi:F0F1 ATP synthase subunit gamma [Limnobacter humi]|uniref:ATP synthase gamma chain n=1 Tax=Limnobacter humi TaxID=1778671 RepID=A0ABT1WGV2_9BURK|nr:F0F1 ATP synthase subunit gamma [Limnobacter humi]MCQ8895659.1 F0F1 ATP synthase subunit gamma [Limnobacter humi]